MKWVPFYEYKKLNNLIDSLTILTKSPNCPLEVIDAISNFVDSGIILDVYTNRDATSATNEIDVLIRPQLSQSWREFITALWAFDSNSCAEHDILPLQFDKLN